MPFELFNIAGGVDLMVTGNLGVQEAKALWGALQPSIDAKATVRLRAGGLEEIDTSILQILCRMSRSGQLSIGETSDGLLAALKHRGLEFSPQPKTPAADAHNSLSDRNAKAKSARLTHG